MPAKPQLQLLPAAEICLHFDAPGCAGQQVFDGEIFSGGASPPVRNIFTLLYSHQAWKPTTPDSILAQRDRLRGTPHSQRSLNRTIHE